MNEDDYDDNTILFRFGPGEKVWVKDRYGKLVEATVREQCGHPGRHPFYPGGEGYKLDGELWWDCYPGCRVMKTREEAKAVRLDPKAYA